MPRRAWSDAAAPPRDPNRLQPSNDCAEIGACLFTRREHPEVLNNPKKTVLRSNARAVGPNGSGYFAPLTFCRTLRNLLKTNVQLPVENNTGTNVFLPRGALYG